MFLSLINVLNLPQGGSLWDANPILMWNISHPYGQPKQIGPTHPNTKQRVLGRYLALGGNTSIRRGFMIFPSCSGIFSTMGLTCFVRFLSKLQDMVDNWTWDPPWKSSRFTPYGLAWNKSPKLGCKQNCSPHIFCVDPSYAMKIRRCGWVNQEGSSSFTA